MAPLPSTSADPANPEKAPDSDRTESTQNVQYQEPSDQETSINEPLSRKKSKWKPWKKYEDGQEIRWWFASTAAPLLAATLGPLANVTSIAALVSDWRSTVHINGQFVSDFDGVTFKDPRWCYWLNVASLICGFLGNLFLLFNFTQRIRYLIALPMTIIFWYLSTGFLIAITACMDIYTPPVRPYETYTQGFWYAIASAAFYLVCSMILMLNMLGYFLGHYPDHFALTDAQRTLILQTMLFFIWLAGGAAIFVRIESDPGQPGWKYADALYFCDVTILTVGFGDLYPTTNVGRGIVFPYSVGGIIMLGLVISSIYKFMGQLGEENIVQKHIERVRERTISRTVTNSFDLREREHEAGHLVRRRTADHTNHGNSNKKSNISALSQSRPYHTAMGSTVRRIKPVLALPRPLQNRKNRVLLLREEKDRFEKMRSIQHATSKFKKWYALTISTLAFGILWCVGAVVFWQAERNAQGMTYFQALYFCYVSLLTIGYGDMSPRSNAGRCFFVVWSLVAVPTMTILISDMGDTVVSNFKQWSNDLADFTVLPKEGIWRVFLNKHPWLLDWLQTRLENRARKKRMKEGMGVIDPGDPDVEMDADDGEEELDVIQTREPNMERLAAEAEADLSEGLPTLSSLSRRLALSIRRVARDLRLPTPKKYAYEEWVEFTRLIRYSKKDIGERGEGVLEEEDEEGLIEWDWLGEDSPLISGVCESEWLLERLTASLVRLERKKENLQTVGTRAEEKELEGTTNDWADRDAEAPPQRGESSSPSRNSEARHTASGANG